ncbi:DsbC family protein [Halomonas sp. DQ26W]|uniref:DsbC family protein n=1 Tax=Halomonas sp. DQ26W TaxID=2282311 RepID=UPI000DF7865C|nr:DsbC family protein [Halomonas sp. DQ26W]RDB44881.1 DsbC family protein [Halomonas sp. DQ26W]
MNALSRRIASNFFALTLTLTALTLSTSALASEVDRLAERLQVGGQPMPVASIRDTPIDGIYQVRLETGEAFYSDVEGQYFLVGDLYENSGQGLVNLTEQSRNDERAARLAGVADADRVIFRDTTESRVEIVVFTDTTCPYCRQFHDEVPDLNAMGIEVHYLAFPRTGMNGEGARQLQQIWCADNRSEAMTSVKREEAFSGTVDCDNPVEAQYHLGMEVGVKGTPAIVLPDGRMVPGYVPAERLAAMLGLDG